ncbi:MAG: methionyl-tRNA formyltransferase [Desulfotalea sp.]
MVEQLGSPKPLRIVFMGTPDFAATNLQALLKGQDKIVAVVTQPDRPKGRGKNLSPPAVKVVAEEAGLPILQPTKIKTNEFRDELLSYNADLFIVIAYGRILPKALLDIPKLGCVNVHGSLLPRHRGAAPIQWAVILGDKEAGVTTMLMDEGMDTGDILVKKTIIPTAYETAGSLFDKLANLGTDALLETIEGLRQGTITPEPQSHGEATEAPMLSKNDGLVDWNKTAKEIHCLIRGMDPWPCAYSFLAGKRMRLFAPKIFAKKTKETPGTILSASKEGLIVATGDSAILIEEIQPEGKKRMPVASFICGAKIDAGSSFLSEKI